MDRLTSLSIEDAETTIRADYLHQLLLIQRMLPQMLAHGGGCVVNMSWGTAYLDPPAPAGAGGRGVAYAASKAAFTRIVPSSTWSTPPTASAPSTSIPDSW